MTTCTCESCVFMRRTDKDRKTGALTVTCRPIDYLSANMKRLIPRIVTNKECSRFLMSKDKKKE